MLGSLKKHRNTSWYACGKHPWAKDFFTVGDSFPLAEAFSRWLNQGVSELTMRGHSLETPVSWRFWVKTPVQDHLVCGVVKNSFDGMRRAFPLLVIGQGRVPDWQKHWELLPIVFENAWLDMETFAMQNYLDRSQFLAALERLKYPQCTWHEWSDCGVPESTILMSDCPAGFYQRGCSQIDLSSVPEQNLTGAVSMVHRQYKLNMSSMPSSVFMGGDLARRFIILLTDPLSIENFVLLWNPLPDS